MINNAMIDIVIVEPGVSSGTTQGVHVMAFTLLPNIVVIAPGGHHYHYH